MAPKLSRSGSRKCAIMMLWLTAGVIALLRAAMQFSGSTGPTAARSSQHGRQSSIQKPFSTDSMGTRSLPSKTSQQAKRGGGGGGDDLSGSIFGAGGGLVIGVLGALGAALAVGNPLVGLAGLAAAAAASFLTGLTGDGGNQQQQQSWNPFGGGSQQQEQSWNPFGGSQKQEQSWNPFGGGGGGQSRGRDEPNVVVSSGGGLVGGAVAAVAFAGLYAVFLASPLLGAGGFAALAAGYAAFTAITGGDNRAY